MKRHKVGDLTPAGYNPRKIGEAADKRLERSMQKYGDLSGIVVNRRSGRIVGGHQRARHITAEATIIVSEEWEKPNSQGTVAVGYIDVGGERWSYREVDVDETTEKAMNLAANKHGGEWDLPKLSEILVDLSDEGYDLDLTGFTADDVSKITGVGVDLGEDQTDKLVTDTYQILVTCRTEDEQQTLLRRLEEEGVECRALIF